MADLLKAFTELFRIFSPAQRWIVIVAMLIIGFAVYVPTHMAGQQEVLATADLYTRNQPEISGADGTEMAYASNDVMHNNT